MANKAVTFPPKYVVWLAFSGVAFWGLIVFTGMRLPFFYTKFSFNFRLFVLFPLIFLPLLYFGYIYRKPNQATSYRKLMGGIRARKERIKGTLYGLLGLVMVPGGLAWTSIAFPAWATMLFASEKYAHVYHVSDIEVRSGAKWSTLFDVELIDSSGEKVVLRLGRSRYENNHWQRGEEVCVIGRTWMFGTIIDETSRYLDRCGR